MLHLHFPSVNILKIPDTQIEKMNEQLIKKNNNTSYFFGKKITQALGTFVII